MEGGTVADIAFYRVAQDRDARGDAETYVPGTPTLGLLPQPQSKFAPESLYRAMKERYGDRHHVIAPLLKGIDAPSPLTLEKGHPIHLISEPLGSGRGLAAIGLAAKLSGAKGEHSMTVLCRTLWTRAWTSRGSS